jgi:exopolysaccharide biosynthesis WecB/TagA/CpsF family protein
LCIGASIDFLTGKQRRAPLWVQKAGLEWLHRLLSDPRRLTSRYLIECPRIFYLIWAKRRIT